MSDFMGNACGSRPFAEPIMEENGIKYKVKVWDKINKQTISMDHLLYSVEDDCFYGAEYDRQCGIYRINKNYIPYWEKIF